MTPSKENTAVAVPVSIAAVSIRPPRPPAPPPDPTRHNMPLVDIQLTEEQREVNSWTVGVLSDSPKFNPAMVRLRPPLTAEFTLSA